MFELLASHKCPSTCCLGPPLHWLFTVYLASDSELQALTVSVGLPSSQTLPGCFAGLGPVLKCFLIFPATDSWCSFSDRPSFWNSHWMKPVSYYSYETRRLKSIRRCQPYNLAIEIGTQCGVMQRFSTSPWSTPQHCTLTQSHFRSWQSPLMSWWVKSGVIDEGDIQNVQGGGPPGQLWEPLVCIGFRLNYSQWPRDVPAPAALCISDPLPPASIHNYQLLRRQMGQRELVPNPNANSDAPGLELQQVVFATSRCLNALSCCMWLAY